MLWSLLSVVAQNGTGAVTNYVAFYNRDLLGVATWVATWVLPLTSDWIDTSHGHG